MRILFCSLPENIVFPEELIPLVRNALLVSAGMEGLKESEIEVEVVFTNNTEIHRLNHEYRGYDRATDVLSFAWGESDPFPGDEGQLGQIIVSLETARCQAEEYGHSLEREVAFLCIHGFLHLLGYDHELGPAEEARMRDREREILQTLKITREGDGQ